MRCRYVVALWALGNLAVLFAPPVGLYRMLDVQVQEEYATGVRTTTDGDTIFIPAAELFLKLLAVLVAINLTIVAYRLLRRQRARPRAA